MSKVRPPAVAGRFYPDDPATLADTVDALLRAAPGRPLGPDFQAKAFIAPHAGFIYSGPVAAAAYREVAKRAGEISRVVLLGPAHRVAFAGLAVPRAEAFATPLGEVPLATSSLPENIHRDDTAHAMEHCLEVQLPFLQRVLRDFSLVPLLVGDAVPRVVSEVIDKLWGGAETLIVVSSDLSHYLSYEEAHEIDTATAEMVTHLDAELAHEQACGATPVSGLILSARRRGLRAQLLALCNSGDTAGDRNRVVGYGAFAFGETLS